MSVSTIGLKCHHFAQGRRKLGTGTGTEDQ